MQIKSANVAHGSAKPLFSRVKPPERAVPLVGRSEKGIRRSDAATGRFQLHIYPEAFLFAAKKKQPTYGYTTRRL